ncbi:MAG TPA: SgcJ/EcaC family oxidoreductase [Casimicrobiaceae bacterium]|nr:SgcJ/EcaC family oxidoreductase [Casimicrobiaceae bacterium]
MKGTHMRARKPEDLDRLFQEALNAGKIDDLVALYEPQATLMPMPGKLVTGHAAIREALNGFLAGKPKISIAPSVAAQSGDVAVVNGKWNLEVAGQDGKRTQMSAQEVVVARRQADGRWLIAIDLPFGVGG